MAEYGRAPPHQATMPGFAGWSPPRLLYLMPPQGAGKGHVMGPCLDPTCLELQQQQNAALSPRGERNRGHRLDTKDRNSALKKKKDSH